MIMRYIHLTQHPNVFCAVTGLRVAEFDELLGDVLPAYANQEQQRLARPDRQRAIGAGHPFDLKDRDHILLTVVWLRVYPTHEVLGYLFGVSDSTVSRLIKRVLPVLEATGRDTMRMPDPGKKRRRTLDDLLQDTPELAVVIDSFEQRVQRPRDRDEADGYYSGKKKQHTLKSQVAVDETTGQVVDVADSVRGPTADLALLEQSQLLDRLPAGVGGIGDLAYVVHVGDSRVYLVTKDGLEQVTRDHSLVRRLIELNQLTEEEAADHPQKNVLYRAIGQSESLEVDAITRRLPPNSRLLLCSDGLWNQVDDKEIGEIVMTHDNPQEACDKLVALANTRGGTDNITTILLMIPA